jgi:Txe/YoeB family toxin of Txe-Axe toxin-antitoxin module
LEYKEKIKELIYDNRAIDDDLQIIPQSKRLEKTFSEIIQQIKSDGYAGCRIIEAMNNLVAAEK